MLAAAAAASQVVMVQRTMCTVVYSGPNPGALLYSLFAVITHTQFQLVVS